jgi:hypothetical protein
MATNVEVQEMEMFGLLEGKQEDPGPARRMKTLLKIKDSGGSVKIEAQFNPEMGVEKERLVKVGRASVAVPEGFLCGTCGYGLIGCRRCTLRLNDM